MKKEYIAPTTTLEIYKVSECILSGSDNSTKPDNPIYGDNDGYGDTDDDDNLKDARNRYASSYSISRGGWKSNGLW